MSQPVALLNGEFVPASAAVVPVDDAGFMLGVTVPEQLRTFGGQLFRLEQHLERLFRGLAIVGVQCPFSREELATMAVDLVARNYALLTPGDDLGLTMFVTPGPLAPQPGRRPLVAMHTRKLAFAAAQQLYAHGQDLVTTSIRQVPDNCWPAELKCRSRMHYWLADHEAQRIAPGARAVLLDQQGFVTEASTANLLIYRRDEGFVSPPPEAILPGISVAMLAGLARELGIAFSHRQVTVGDLASADEVLLCSTSACVWPVLKFDGQAIGSGAPGPIFRRLIAAWSEQVGIDIVAQASQFAGR